VCSFTFVPFNDTGNRSETLHSEDLSLTVHRLMQLAKARSHYQKSRLYPEGPMFKLRRDIGYHDRLFMGFLTSAIQTPAYYLKVLHTASFHTQSQSFIDHPII